MLKRIAGALSCMGRSYLGASKVLAAMAGNFKAGLCTASWYMAMAGEGTMCPGHGIRVAK